MVFELFAFLCLSLTVSGIVLLLPKKARLFGKIILSLGLLIGFTMLTLIGAIILSLSGKDTYAIFLMAGSTLIYLLILLSLFGLIKKKAAWISYLSVWVIGLLIFSVIFIRDVKDSSIPVMQDRADLLYEYSPTNYDSKVALLNEPSTLKLENELPVMDGATALYPIYSAFSKAVYPDSGYEKVLCSGTTDAYKNIVDGACDIAFLAAPSEKQLSYAKENGVELELTPIGYEAFVFFVNSKNPIDELSVSQIKDIYSGRVTSWKELGVRGVGKIKAFQRDEGSGSQSALLRLMKDDTLMKAPENEINSMGEIITETADYKNYKNAIGFSFRFYSSEMVANNQIKLLKLDGVYPDRENIENGKYPISDKFYMVTRKDDKSENTEKLMDWILSEQGTYLIDKTGYTPVQTVKKVS